VIAREADGSIHLTPRYGGEQLSLIRGFGVFFDKTGVMTPMVFSNFASKFGSVPDVMVFFHLHPVEKPTVADDERYSISRFTAIPGCYRLVIKHGFMDEVISPDLSALIYEHIRNWVIRQAHRAEDEREAKERDGLQVIQAVKKSEDNGGVLQPMDGTENGKDGSDSNTNGISEATSGDSAPPAAAASDSPAPAATNDALGAPAATFSDPEKKREPIELRNEKVAAELARLDRAYATKVMYVVGKEQMRIKKGTHIPRRIVLELFLWIRDNTRAKIANLRLAMERVVEVGFVKEI
jgi:KUP system potassium uptake protein